jgi:hypothetical protein
MIKTLLCATLALGSLGSLLAADAFTGNWKLDVAKSTFASDNPAPKELTLTFTEQGASRTQILGHCRRRKRNLYSVDSAADGRDCELPRGSGAERRCLREACRCPNPSDDPERRGGRKPHVPSQR